MRNSQPEFLIFDRDRISAAAFGKVDEMNINCPVVVANGEHPEMFGFTHQETGPRPQWLLELDVDGTIRHSSSHPSSATDGGTRPLIGSNFFDLAPVLGDLTDLRKDFFGFVKSAKNRETARLRANAAGNHDAMVVLTRSFDTYPTRKEIVLMEIRSE